jgi:hypothetical protein
MRIDRHRHALEAAGLLETGDEIAEGVVGHED